ncbi:hypothetical protein FLLO111716_06125 [Flavobacterium longum]|uniref:hypothetical protein n=1 Tax=Flavobacterium longum TaxID=1299340 RepID=UPI0039EACE27
MGAGFVILMYLIAIFVVSAVLALVAIVITSIVAKPPKRRKIVAAALSPFVFFYGWFFMGLFATGAVSGWKNVDIGIGDAWYVPINDEYSMLMIDLTEEAYIQRNGEDILTVRQIQQVDDVLIGQNTDGWYFSLNLHGHKLKLYQSREELLSARKGFEVALDDVAAFYTKRKREILGIWMVIVPAATFLLSAAATFLFARLITYGSFLSRRRTY